MSLADPQSITVSGATSSLPRTSVEGDETTYSSSDGLLKLSVSHSESAKGRKRKSIRIDATKVTTDPFKPTENVEVSTSMYVVFDIPKAGYTNTELLALWTGFRTALAATTDLIPQKVLAGES